MSFESICVKRVCVYIFQKETQGTLVCNCRVNKIVPSMMIAERKMWTIYYLKKVCLGLIEGEFKKQKYYDHVRSFLHEFYVNNTNLWSYVRQMKIRKSVTAALVWEVLRYAKAYSNITKRSSLCFHKKLKIITYPYLDERINRWYELVTKSRHWNKFLLKNVNSKDLLKNY